MQRAAGCRPAGGAELFMKLSSLLPESDRLAVSAALLDAALVRGDKGIEIEFEREMPARNFLSVAHNRKELCAAAAKLWNIEGAADAQLTEAVRAEPEPAPASRPPPRSRSPSRSPAKRLARRSPPRAPRSRRYCARPERSCSTSGART